MVKKSYPLHLLLCALAGILYAWGFPSKLISSVPVLPPILGIALFLSTLAPKGQERPLSQQAGLLIAFSLGIYLLGQSWLSFTLAEFAYVPSPLNHLLGLLLAPLLIPHYWAYLLGRKLLAPLTRSIGAWALLPTNAMALVLLESFIPLQFPAHLGHSWPIRAPFAALAPLFGVPLYSFISHYAAQILGLTLAGYPSPAARTRTQALGLFVGLALGLGAALLWVRPPWEQWPSRKSIHLRIVQAGIGNLLKLSAEQGDEAAIKQVNERYQRLSLTPSSSPLNLIVWPETAIGDLLSSELLRKRHLHWPPAVYQVTQQTGAELVTGGYDLDLEQEQVNFEGQYNTLFHVDAKGDLKEVYHKHLLIPFGETMPFGPLNRWLAQVFPGASFFARGERKPLLSLRGGERFIPAICYEILFPRFINGYLNQLQRQGKKRPHFIVNLTNDSWYGDTSEPLQHLFLSHWRAVELGLPIVRSTNTGITSILYPDGNESPRMAVGKQGILDLRLTLQQTQATPYQRYGILPCLLLMIVMSCLGLGALRSRGKPLSKKIV